MRHFFFGGVNPAPHKASTRRKPIARLEYAPKQVVIPLGDETIPAVKPGTQVKVGQPIALGQGAGVTAHASVSGRVSAIEERPHPWGGTAMAIVIENDGMDTPWPNRPEPLDPTQVTKELLLARVREAGIVGMGGGAYPTTKKLSQA
ncbi:MAG: electron transport complex subunit RsxC, partial [Oscillibacter sp.]|nr:electron transport complex subunit RsxC [Oscillibacter sp.]